MNDLPSCHHKSMVFSVVSLFLIDYGSFKVSLVHPPYTSFLFLCIVASPARRHLLRVRLETPPVRSGDWFDEKGIGKRHVGGGGCHCDLSAWNSEICDGSPRLMCTSFVHSFSTLPYGFFHPDDSSLPSIRQGSTSFVCQWTLAL